MKKAAKKSAAKGINKTAGKTTTGVISNYKGVKGKSGNKNTSATGRPGPAFKKGGSVTK